MRNCLILGAGRSGTSMMGGILSGAGYYMGERLHGPREANPKGLFEDEEINLVNEALLARVVPGRPPGRLGRHLLRRRPAEWQRWLAEVAPGTPIAADGELAERIRLQTGRSPFCFKDPRFCYTLPAWRPFLGEAALICVFRSPAATAASIQRECEQPYLRDLKIDRERILRVWSLMYTHVLDVHRHEGDWLFLHYDQIAQGSAARDVERLLGVVGDWSFPEPALGSAASGPVPAVAAPVYRRLCDAAGHEPAI